MVMRELWIGMMWSVALLPGLAGIATVVVALLLGDPTSKVDFFIRVLAALGGFVAGIVAWAAFSLVVKSNAKVDRANARMFRELQLRVSSASRIHAAACSPVPAGETAEAACAEAGAHLTELTAALDSTQPLTSREWAEGSGYIASWQKLHRAEEALLEVMPDSSAATDGFYDVKRLEGSRIAGKRDLLSVARAAVRALSPGLGARFGAGQTANGTPQPPALTDREARAALRKNRRIINEYRDDAAAGLVSLRTRLTANVLFTGLVGYLFVTVAVIAAVPVALLLSASVIYLVGALVGLAHRAYKDARSRTAKELDDYGLGNAQMVHAALVSGLAGFAGVFVTAILAEKTIVEAIVPSATVTNLADVFNILITPTSLLLAAIFGLTPGLLFGQLRDQGDALKDKLSSSEADGSADGNGNGDSEE